MTTVRFANILKSRTFILCVVSTLPMLSSCSSIAKEPLPKRNLTATLYTDGTCEYSLENMGSDLREFQKWELFDTHEGPGVLTIICFNDRVRSERGFSELSPEFWPSVRIRLRNFGTNELSESESEAGFQFRPELRRDHYETKGRQSVVRGSDLDWSAWLSLGAGTRANKDHLPVTEREKSPCGVTFTSDSSSSNRGTLLSESKQKETGIYIEFNTTVIASPDGAQGPCSW